jgi:hypothetical protein
VAAATVLLLVGSQFAWLSPTNFHGTDEWLILSLVSRGIVAFPYANRPFALAGSLPAALFDDPVTPHFALHGLYLATTGILVFLIVRRLAPDQVLLGWLAGVLAALWAPRDRLRLATVQMVAYSGFMVGLLLALILLVEWWRRRRWWWLGAACVVAWATVRAYEGALPLLLGAPLLLARFAPVRAGWSWAPGWYAALGVALAQMVGLLDPGPGRLDYQARIGLDPSLLPMAGRLLHHYGLGLLPLVQAPPYALAGASALPTLAAFWAALAYVLLRWQAPTRERRAHAVAMVLGLALAGLGSAPFAVSAALTTPDRTQFLPAPGLGLFLAGAALWLGSWLPTRWRPFAVAALGGWVVWVGTVRVVAMQRRWDTRSTFGAQRQSLRQLTRIAPDLRPNTLVVLVDRTGSWGPHDFPHAVEYLYARRATGHVWGLRSFLCEVELTDAGVLRRPHPAVRGPWRSPPTRHRYDEVVFVRYAADGTLHLFDHWPSRVLPQPPGSAYAPRARIVEGGPEPRSRAVLR